MSREFPSIYVQGQDNRTSDEFHDDQGKALIIRAEGEGINTEGLSLNGRGGGYRGQAERRGLKVAENPLGTKTLSNSERYDNAVRAGGGETAQEAQDRKAAERERVANLRKSIKGM